MIQLFFSILQNGDTSLMNAADKGHVSIARDLLRAKADPNIQNVVCYILMCDKL